MNLYKRVFLGALVLSIGLLGISCSDSTEYSENPYELDLTEIELGTPYLDQQVPAYAYKIYKFTATENKSYIIEVSNTGSNLGWTLYETLIHPEQDIVCEQNESAEVADEIGVTPPLVAGETYYLKIDERDNTDSYFDMLVHTPEL